MSPLRHCSNNSGRATSLRQTIGCRWRSSPGRAGDGIATSETTTDISGDKAASAGGVATFVVKKIFLKTIESRFQNLRLPKPVKLGIPISPPLYSSHRVLFPEIFSLFIRLQR